MTLRIAVVPILTAALLPTMADAQVNVDEPVRFDGHAVVRASIETPKDLRVMGAITDDVWSHGVGFGEVDFRIEPDALTVLDETGIEYRILIDDVQAVIDEQMGGNQIQGNFFDDYRTRAEIEARMNDLELARPDLAEVIDIGDSIQGRDIFAIKITSSTGSNKPAVVLNYTQHAREWISAASGIYLADYLVNNYGIDSNTTALMDAVEFYIIPISNPDGYEYTWSSNRLWRKNRRNNGNGTTGVDLNRNWGRGWGGEGSSGSGDSDIYRGTSAFSEPETQALRDLMLSLPNFAAHMDVHSYSQLVLQPYGYTSNLPPDHAELDELGGLINDAMEAPFGLQFVHGPIYTTIYPASGNAVDWAYQDGGALSFSPELRDEGQFGFLLPPEQIVDGATEAMAGALELAKWVSVQLRFSFPSGLPAYVTPDTSTPIQINIDPANGGTYQSGSGLLFTRVNGGSYTSSPLASLGGNLYEGTLPATACGDTLDFYFEAQTTGGVVQRTPTGAPAEYYSTVSSDVETVFADDFESNTGWSVTNIALEDGPWQRGIPADGDRGDPAADFDGSGQCYVTDNQAGNSDVDGGPTRLTSPSIDLSGGDATIRYARWMYNDDLDADRLTTEVSNDDGNNWVFVDDVQNTSGWEVHEFLVSDYVAPTSVVRVRFSATDNPNDSVTEAGIDAFEVIRISCDGGGGNDLTLNIGPLVGGQNGQFDVTDGRPNELTYLVYSLAGLGNTYVPALDVTLDLRNPKLATDATATDANGDVSWTLPVPPAASGRTVWFQAAQFQDTSNTVEVIAQ